MYIQRREEILLFLDQHTNATVKDLSDQLAVSEMTIRRDLNKMEEEGVVKRSFGGVSVANALLMEQSIGVRAANMPAAKRRMAMLAAELVHDGESVLLDSGTTILELSKILAKKPVHMVTSSLLIAANATKGQASVLLSGGALDVNFQTLTGRTAIDFYDRVNCRYAFVSAGGVSIERGITEFTEDAAALKHAMLTHAEVRVLMVDRTKLDTVRMFRASHLDEIDIVITDEMPPKEYTTCFADHGISLMVAKEE